MGDVQQQIADGARPLARVGDRIEHGQDIPGNVVRLLDGAPGSRRTGRWIWQRDGDSFHLVIDETMTPRLGPPRAPDELRDLFPSHWPMEVVEVDPEPRQGMGFAVDDSNIAPEPQPAELPVGAHAFVSSGRDTRCEQLLHGGRMCGRSPLALMHEAAEPGPLVLTLPEVPAEAVALIGGKSGGRWERTAYGWRTEGWHLTFSALLEREGSVTVEFAPPREPRTWPKLDPAPEIDLPRTVDVDGHGRWSRLATHHFYPEADPNGAPLTLAGLRELGEVREVLT